MLNDLTKVGLTANTATLEPRQTASAIGRVGARGVARCLVATDGAGAGLSIRTAAHISNVATLYLDTCTASPTAHIWRPNRGTAQRAFWTLELPLKQDISDAQPFKPFVCSVWSDRRLCLVCTVPKVLIIRSLALA